jgi:tetratricopeptide (TPR) repeat protein
MRTLALSLLLAAAASAANWTDRQEYDLVLNVRAEISPLKRIESLDRWKSAYPKSEFAPIRQELYLSAYQALGDSPHTFSAAGDLLAAQPDNLVGAYWFALLLPEAKSASPEQLALGEKAAQRLVPGAWPDSSVVLIGHRALGWIHWQRGEYAPAEAEFRECLKVDPNDAEISAWFGTVLALAGQPDQRVPALWQLARAASYRDAGALSDGLRRQYGELLDRLYTAYHGDASGLDQLRAAAAAAPFPPDRFDIESATAAALRRQDEALTRIDPQLAAWVRIRQNLEAPDGDKYFADTLHSNPLPKLKGTLIKAEPKDSPSELTIGLIDPAQAEIVLKLSSPLPNDAPPGTVLEFEGTADSVARSPFALTAISDPSKISGWPAAPPPPAHPVRKPTHK